MDPSDLPPIVVTERLLLRRRGPHLAIYAITTRAEDAPRLGDARLAPHDEHDDARIADVTLLPEARGHGYGREAGRALLAVAFAEGGARYVDVFVAMDDPAAVATATHLGLKNLRAAEDRGPTVRRFRAHHPPA